MERERVKKDEKYWYLVFFGGEVLIYSMIERNFSDDDEHFAMGNYFHTKEEAESMARRIRAVFKGADVIETPSEDDMLGEIPIIDDPSDYVGCGRRLGWRECYNWLKSKIVK